MLKADMTKVQVDANGRLRHFLTIDGLTPHLLNQLLTTAQHFVTLHQQGIKKHALLEGTTVANLFFEASTRTRTTFEIAAKKLSADVISININTSATTKGESLLDTIRNLESMHVDMFVVRHETSGAAHFIAQHVRPQVSVINGGDGCHAHPTQALLDMLTIQQHKGEIEGLKVAIVGDILHSRVARSQIIALSLLGAAEIRVIAPKTLLPTAIDQMGVHVYHDMKAGLKDIDVIIMLRLQKERMQNSLIPSQHEYFNTYGLSKEKLMLAKSDAIVMHPGPINRDVEIASDIADSPRAVILQQVSNGIALRMAVMALAAGREVNA